MILFFPGHFLAVDDMLFGVRKMQAFVPTTNHQLAPVVRETDRKALTAHSLLLILNVDDGGSEGTVGRRLDAEADDAVDLLVQKVARLHHRAAEDVLVTVRILIRVQVLVLEQEVVHAEKARVLASLHVSLLVSAALAVLDRTRPLEVLGLGTQVLECL